MEAVRRESAALSFAISGHLAKYSQRGKRMYLAEMSEAHIEACVDLFIDVFSKAPWNDIYASREQVAGFFRNYIHNNGFIGFVLKDKNAVLAMSIGLEKPWIHGMEYYIDQFCVKAELQGQGIGSIFLKRIEKELRRKKINAVILNTERGFPAEKFYLKNGFQALHEYVILSKRV